LLTEFFSAKIKHSFQTSKFLSHSVIASLRSNPESDQCTWIASQARNDEGQSHLRLIDSFIRVSQ